MKILYVTDIGYIGQTSGFQLGPRPPMSWISSLNTFHCDYLNLDKLPYNDFDIAIIGCIHEKVDILNLNIIEKIKKVAKKILFQHDSDHRFFYQNNSIERSYMLCYIIMNVDGILAHNELDKKYYENLFQKPTFIHRQLLLDIYPQLNTPSNKTGFILGGIGDRYGSLDSYLLAQEYSEPTYCFGSNNIPGLELLPTNYDYISYNQTLSKFKIGINLTPFAIGGSFPLQCAMVKVPCVGWNNSEPLKTCFPDLVADYGNFELLRKQIHMLLNNKEYYNEISEKARNVFLQEYSVETYLENMKSIFKQI
jgi:glycosyltransferase involved in cell wall biosynthesis